MYGECILTVYSVMFLTVEVLENTKFAFSIICFCNKCQYWYYCENKWSKSWVYITYWWPKSSVIAKKSLEVLRNTSKKLHLRLTEHHAMKAYWGSGGIGPPILDLGTRWRWVVSFMPRPLYPQYLLDRRTKQDKPRQYRYNIIYFLIV